MAPKQARQERQLERQRGAGIRQVKNTDIGLVIPGQDHVPLQPRKSGRPKKTPQPEALPPQETSRNTPGTVLQSQRSSRRTPTVLAPQESSKRTPANDSLPSQRSSGNVTSSALGKRARSTSENATQDVADDSQSGKPKRPRLAERPETITEVRTPIARGSLAQERQGQNDIARSKPKRRKKRKSIGQQSTKRVRPFASSSLRREDNRHDERKGRPKAIESATMIADDGAQNQLGLGNQDPGAVQDPRSDLIVIRSVEPTIGTGFTPRKRKRRKRVSIGQQSKRKAKPTMVIVKEEPEEEEGVSMNETTQQHHPDTVEQILEESEMVEAHLGKEDSQPRNDDLTKPRQMEAAKKTKRKKRKSIGQQKPRRTSVKGLALAKPPASHGASSKAAQITNSKAISAAAETSEVSTRANSADLNEDHESSNENFAQPHPKKTRRPPKIVQKASKTITKKTKPRPTSDFAQPKVLKATKPTSSKRPIPSNVIPITVYRPTTPDSASSDSDKEDDLPQTAMNDTSKTFNSVDVLAQITLERLAILNEKISAQPSATQTHKKALKLYTQELDQRMRQLSRALDTNVAVKAQVKGLSKEEREVKKELKEVEGERKRVRERIEELEREKRRWELEEALGRIQEIARKGWEMERAKERGEDPMVVRD